MPTLHTIYDFANEPMNLFFLFPVPFIIGGLIILIYHLKLTKTEDGINGPFKPIFPGADNKGIDTKNKGIAFGIIFTVVGTASTILMYYAQLPMFNFYKKICKEKHYTIVQGRVKNYHPMPEGGHDTERFDVNGVHFEFMDYGERNYGYNNAASHGGAIKSNLFVRIGYFNDGERNLILKLDIE